VITTDLADFRIYRRGPARGDSADSIRRNYDFRFLGERLSVDFRAASARRKRASMFPPSSLASLAAGFPSSTECHR